VASISGDLHSESQQIQLFRDTGVSKSLLVLASRPSQDWNLFFTNTLWIFQNFFW